MMFALRGEATWVPADVVYSGPDGLVVRHEGEPDLVLAGGARLSDFWYWLDGQRVTLVYRFYENGRWSHARQYSGIVRGYVHNKPIKRPDGSYIFRPEAYFTLSDSPGSRVDHIWNQTSGPVRGTLTVEP